MGCKTTSALIRVQSLARGALLCNRKNTDRMVTALCGAKSEILSLYSWNRN